MNPTPAKPAITRHPRGDLPRSSRSLRLLRRACRHIPIFVPSQNRAVRRRPQRQSPVIARLVHPSALRRKPRSRLKQCAQSKVDHRLCARPQLQISPHRRNKERSTCPHLIFTRNQMIDHIAPMKVRDRHPRRRRVAPDHLYQRSHLRRTVRTPNHTRDRSTGRPRGNAERCTRQHQRQKHELHLGSLHSNAVLRVDGCSK
jgi:hypothetical protein